jgi:phage baseplate assembly protein W
MAIEVKRPALDFQKDVAIGIDLPMSSFQGSSFTLNYTSIDQAAANAKNLLLTNHGERPMRPFFGCNLRRVLFDNIGPDDLFVDTIKQTILENFEIQLPYIDINTLEVLQSDTNPNQIKIQMTIGLVGNRFDTRQIDVVVEAET